MDKCNGRSTEYLMQCRQTWAGLSTHDDARWKYLQSRLEGAIARRPDPSPRHPDRPEVPPPFYLVTTNHTTHTR